MERRSNFGARIERFKDVTSTQDVAKELAEAGAAEGTVVVAERQDKGRGRLGRKWLSPSGGLWFSIILRPNIPANDASRLTLMAAVAIAGALRDQAGIEAHIKWPNDVLVNGKKVCGILTEGGVRGHVLEYVAIGIGIDVNNNVDDLPSELLVPATTLKDEAGQELDLSELLNCCLRSLETEYKDLHEFNLILSRWRMLSAVIDQRVSVSEQMKSVEGKAIDIDETGALLVADDNGTIHKILTGDLKIL